METLDPNEAMYRVRSGRCRTMTDIDEDEDILNYDDIDDPDAFA